jgi:hypothetical protein
MSANQNAGQADDFDACNESGYYRRHHSTMGLGAAGAGAMGASSPSSTPSAGSTAATGGSARMGGIGGSYDEVRPAYEFGHRAATNPSYSGRAFEEVEMDLQRDFGDESRFEKARDYVRDAFEWKTMLAGVAGAAGAWWAGRKVYDAIKDMNEEDERDVRSFYDAHPARSSGLPYDRARAGYALGYAAARNPDYTGRSFDEVEPHLRTGYMGSAAPQSEAVGEFARRGYDRAATRSTGGSGGI